MRTRLLLRLIVTAAAICFLRQGSDGYAQQSSPAQTTSPAPQDPDALRRDEVASVLRESRRIVSEHGIEDLTHVTVGGIQQAISIRGRDTRNPILLVLHGGPGSPEMAHDFLFQSPWEDYFTVVEWDQRGAGKTYLLNDPATVGPTLNVERMAADTVELTDYLRTRFHKQKIFLLGHSWGSLLGVTVVHEHPELYYAYVGVGQVVNNRRSEAIGWKFALDAATADHNEQAVHDLQSIAPYPGSGVPPIAHVGLDREWLEYYGGLGWERKNFGFVSGAWELSPDYTDADLDAIGGGSQLSLGHLLPAMLDVNFDHTTDFDCPIFLFIGRHDYSVSHQLAAEWYAKLHAPQKKFVWFENSAHLPMIEEPGRFLYHLVTDVRPIAVRARDVPPGDGG